MEKELSNALGELKEILKEISPRKSNFIIDFLMKVATAVSTAGILALFALFTVHIPKLNASIDRLGWQQEQMKEDLDSFKAFTQKPRFTKDDFILEMRLYDRRLQLIENELGDRSSFMSKTEERLNKLEKE